MWAGPRFQLRTHIVKMIHGPDPVEKVHWQPRDKRELASLWIPDSVKNTRKPRQHFCLWHSATERDARPTLTKKLLTVLCERLHVHHVGKACVLYMCTECYGPLPVAGVGFQIASPVFPPLPPPVLKRAHEERARSQRVCLCLGLRSGQLACGLARYYLTVWEKEVCIGLWVTLSDV